jgi:hypothetical protein
LGSAVETGRKYGTLPIESKESMRWLQSSEQSAIVLDNALMVTSIADREGDITELFDRRGAEHLLIRSRDDRRIKLPDGSNGKLYQYLSGVPSSGEYTFCMKADKRKSRQKRDVSVDLKFSKVTLFPHKLKGKEIELYAVEAIERNAVAGQKPVLWRILTTHVVDNVSQARQIIDWYAMRWNIEQIFRLIKNKGLAIEDSTLETGKALILMTIMALFAASKILVLHTASKEKDPQPIKKTFSRQEVLCLKALCVQYEGKTDKQRNNHPPDSLQWCYWVIARIGGWKTQEKQAGVITLFRGWNQFQKIYHGWTIAQTFVS